MKTIARKIPTPILDLSSYVLVPRQEWEALSRKKSLHKLDNTLDTHLATPTYQKKIRKILSAAKKNNDFVSAQEIEKEFLED